MADLWTDERLEEVLRDAGRRAPAPVPPGLAETVLARLADEPAPAVDGRWAAVRRLADRVLEWARGRIAWLVAVLVGLVTAVVLVVSPVGATVAEWFGFHGVEVHRDDGPPPTGTPTVPPAGDDLSLAEADALVDFAPRVPAELGDPDQVTVSADRKLLSMSWGTGSETVRLDQFDGEVEPRFWKSVSDADFVMVGPHDGLWLPTPHEVALLDGDREVLLPPRLAAQTLLWFEGGVTYRLEGPFTQATAITIAESLR
ncbi:hypothetical protein [Nocardioides speluncae]|uniref:hypothetical protein n=1 Tax=Nocardioides speluncae TaxID=2670337 RepID=UPI000D69EA1C|nr:hypothetical protein [Nocardioides speluncae]